MMISKKCRPKYSDKDVLPQLEIEEQYDVLKQLGRGTYGKVLLANCHKTNCQIALKVFPKRICSLSDFLREFQLSYYLSPHHNILDTFDFAFETRDSFVFVEEAASHGDLFDMIPPQTGLNHSTVRLISMQLASAIQFIHKLRLVHRDIKPENVLLLRQDLTKVKLTDFGMTAQVGTIVRKKSLAIPYTPPEISKKHRGDRYIVRTAADIWAFGVLIFCLQTGSFPWEVASLKDSYFQLFLTWYSRKNAKLPLLWERIPNNMLPLLKKMLCPKRKQRCSIESVINFINDKWKPNDP